MATIGQAWADGAWDVASWQPGAWAAGGATANPEGVTLRTLLDQASIAGQASAGVDVVLRTLLDQTTGSLPGVANAESLILRTTLDAPGVSLLVSVDSVALRTALDETTASVGGLASAADITLRSALDQAAWVIGQAVADDISLRTLLTNANGQIQGEVIVADRIYVIDGDGRVIVRGLDTLIIKPDRGRL